MEIKNLLHGLKIISDKFWPKRKPDWPTNLPGRSGEKLALPDDFNITINRFQKISIPTAEGFEFINVNDIIRLNAYGKCTEIFLTGERIAISPGSIMEFEMILAGMNFIRIHKAHLINLAFIQSYTSGDGGLVTMSDGAEMEVAGRFKEILMEKYINYR